MYSIFEATYSRIFEKSDDETEGPTGYWKVYVITYFGSLGVIFNFSEEKHSM